MPGVEEKERYNEPHDVSRRQRDDKGEEERIVDEVSDCEFLVLGVDLNRADGDEDGSEDQIKHYTDPEIYHGHIEPIRALRPVPQC